MLVWDGEQSGQQAGTARDALLWQKSGRAQIVIPFPVERRGTTPDLERDSPPNRHARSLKAMLFADVRGFGALQDHKVPVFLDEVIRALSDELEKHRSSIIHLKTWGDGLFVVLPTVEDAAALAIDLQTRFHAFDLNAAGLPEFLALRVGGHYGPVYEMEDAIMGKKSFYGSEVSYAARIEPMTVPGSIYVSEAFACALAVGSSDKYRAESVGSMTPRKASDPIKLFSLRNL
jgi:class 3 adenylate cyclase